MPDMFVDFALALGASMELSIIVKATIVLGLGLLAARVASYASASMRHLLLASTFAGLLLLPAAALVMPPLAIDVSTPQVPMDSPLGGVIQRGGEAGPGTASVSARWPDLPIATLLRAVWLFGALLILTWLATALWQVHCLVRRGMSWPDAQNCVNGLAAEMGLRRPVRVVINDRFPVPATCGVFRATVLLPADASIWSEAELHRALIHELEHVRRVDCLTHLLARLACAIYWFNPLVWTAWRQLRLEAERAADDAVLQQTDGPGYAEQLVSLARRLTHHAGHAVLTMTTDSDLSARVAAVLTDGRSRGRVPFRYRVVIGAAAIGLVAALSPRLTASAQQVRAERPGAGFAQQSGGSVPLQRGVSVQMAVTRNAVAVPSADTQDALVVALTADGTAYLGGDRLPTTALAERVRSTLSSRDEKTLYIKADARVPYARLVEIIDAVQKSGVEGLTLLTAQPDPTDQGSRLVPPKGLEMRVVNRSK